MRLNIPIIALTGIFLISILTGCGDPNSPESIIENAVFTDLDGNEVKVSDFKGKVLIIDFWESWCGPCLQVFPSMDELRREYPDHFEVLAVTVGMSEGPEDAREFAEKNGYDFNWLYDQNDVFTRLGGHGIPFKAFVDPDGNFIKMEMGSYGREGDYNKTKEIIETYL
jgi:thiol-disulfide isomerase/thioredoxin